MTTQTARFVLNGKRCAVTLETKPAQGREHFKTTEHGPVPADAIELSLTGEYDGGGGQIADSLRELGAGVPDIVRLCDIWDRWHLNSMTAGSAAQEQFLRDNPIPPAEYAYPKSHYEVAGAKLAAAGLNPDASGYSYGHAWLFEVVPPAVVTEAGEILGRLNGARLGAGDDDAAADDSLDFLPAEERIAAVAARHGVTMSCEQADRNPNMDESDSMDNWRCTFTAKTGRRAKTMTVYFSMGVGHGGKAPTIAQVLSALALDTHGVENAGGFESWCGEYGYDTDSRKAEKTYKTAERQADKLKKFLSAAAYDALITNAEQL